MDGTTGVCGDLIMYSLDVAELEEIILGFRGGGGSFLMGVSPACSFGMGLEMKDGFDLIWWAFLGFLYVGGEGAGEGKGKGVWRRRGGVGCAC